MSKQSKKNKLINDFNAIPRNISNPQEQNNDSYSKSKQNKSISIRLTMENYKVIKGLSKKYKVGVSQMVRDLLADGMRKEALTGYLYAMSTKDKKSLQDIEREIRKVGTNVNQIAASNNKFNKEIAPFDLIDDPNLIVERYQYGEQIKDLEKKFDKLRKEVNDLSRLSQK